MLGACRFRSRRVSDDLQQLEHLPTVIPSLMKVITFVYSDRAVPFSGEFATTCNPAADLGVCEIDGRSHLKLIALDSIVQYWRDIDEQKANRVATHLNDG